MHLLHYIKNNNVTSTLQNVPVPHIVALHIIYYPPTYFILFSPDWPGGGFERLQGILGVFGGCEFATGFVGFGGAELGVAVWG